jgi:hypothetical protein
MGRRAAGVIVVALLFVTGACGSVARTDRDRGPRPSVVVGRHLLDELPITAEPTNPGQRSKAARFAMRLSDDNGKHPAGVPVAVSGPVTRTVTSDAAGYVKATVPPGIYRFNVVEGCHRTVIVNKGGSGQAGVVEGRTTSGTLLLLWQHRYGPAPPVYNDVGGDWPVGRPVEFSFAVEDHCEQQPAPGTSIATYAFKTSANLRITEPPSLRAGDDGRSRVTVACTEAGEVSLDVYDTQNPGDTIDLIQLVIGYDRVPRCAG